MQKATKIPDRIVFSGIVFLLIFAPLAFGSVHVWAYAAIEVIIFALLAIFCISRILTQPRFEWVKTPANGFLLLFLILIGIQVIPLPMSWIKAISPKTADLKNRAEAIIMEARETSSGVSNSPTLFSRLSRFSRFSFTPHSTQREALKLAAYLAMFFLVLNATDSIRRMHILALTLIFLGLFEALYAIIQVFSQSPTVWWWKSRAGEGRYASGTFIGSNHFAGYMEMAFCMTWGYALTLKQKTARMASGMKGFRASFQRYLGWFSPESVRPRKVFFLFAAAIMGVALLLSASRGGILSMCLAMGVTATLFLLKTRKMTFVVAVLAMGLFTFGYGLSIGMDPTLDKLENPQSFHDRLAVSKTLLPMIADYPAVGVGWGNFPDLYPQYATFDHDPGYYNGYAHNDWLEAGTEVGIAGFFIMVAVYVVFLVRLVRIWRKRNNAFAVGIGAGVTAAVVALGFHSLFDFNMHIPANPLTLAAVLALGFVVLHHRGNDYNLSFFWRKSGFSLTPMRRFVFIPVVAAIAVCLIRPAASHLIAEAYCPTEHNSTVNQSKDPDIADILRAISHRPKNSQYYRRQARYRLNCAKPDETAAEKADRFDRAAAALETAIMLNPADAFCWHDLGDLFRQRTGDGYYDLLAKWVPLADRCYDMAVQCAPYNDFILFNAGWHWVWRAILLPEVKPEEKPGGKTDNGDLTQAEAIKKFQALFRQYLAQQPAGWKQCVDRVKTYFPEDAVILGIVPEENEEMKKKVLGYLVKSDE